MNAGNKILDLIPAGRSAWSRGVKDYAADLLGSLRDDQPITKQNLLNGANDWSQWAYGGCGLVYDSAIAKCFATRLSSSARKAATLRPIRESHGLT